MHDTLQLTAVSEEGEGRRWLRAIPDALGVAIVIIGAAALFYPAIRHGTLLGPFDFGKAINLGGSFSHPVRNSVDTDWVFEYWPWLSLDRGLLAHMQFPLWNRYSGMGMPEFANFQSAVLGLSDIIGYLAPLKAEFLVTLFVRIAIAGTGAYAAARVLGSQPIGAAVAGLAFELSGPFAAWMGWPFADVFCWVGWIIAFGYLCYRPRDGSRATPWHFVGLVASVAFAVYGGMPEGLALLLLVVGVFFLVVVVADLFRKEVPGWAGLLRPVGGFAIGLAIGAPLILPGKQLVDGAVRSSAHAQPLESGYMLGALSGRWCGSPLSGQHYICGTNYYEAVGYVGVAILVLAGLGMLRSWGAPGVIPAVAAGAFAVLVSYRIGPIDLWSLASHVGLGAVVPSRARILVPFFLALLAARGADRLASSRLPAGRYERGANGHGRPRYVPIDQRVDGKVLVALSTSVIVVVGVVLLAARVAGDAPFSAMSGIVARVRQDALHVPLAVTALAVMLTAALVGIYLVVPGRARATGEGVPGRAGNSGNRSRTYRRGVALTWSARVALFILLLAYVPTAIATTTPLLTFSHGGPFPENPELVALRRIVGSALVGVVHPGNPASRSAMAGLGITPEENVGYEIRELASYDALLPKALVEGWTGPERSALVDQVAGWFIPSVDSVSLARRYGVEYLLMAGGGPGPAGTRLVHDFPSKDFGTVSLWKVPGAQQATLEPGAAASPLWTDPAAPLRAAPGGTAAGTGGIGTGARGTAVRTGGIGTAVGTAGKGASTGHASALSWLDDNTFAVRVSASAVATLVVRVTDDPGWHATIDGKPIPLHRHAGMTMAVQVPGGVHTIVFHYWPHALSEGLWIAAAGAAAMVMIVAIELLRARLLSRRQVSAGRRSRHLPRSDTGACRLPPGTGAGATPG